MRITHEVEAIVKCRKGPVATEVLEILALLSGGVLLAYYSCRGQGPEQGQTQTPRESRTFAAGRVGGESGGASPSDASGQAGRGGGGGTRAHRGRGARTSGRHRARRGAARPRVAPRALELGHRARPLDGGCRHRATGVRSIKAPEPQRRARPPTAARHPERGAGVDARAPAARDRSPSRARTGSPASCPPATNASAGTSSEASRTRRGLRCRPRCRRWEGARRHLRFHAHARRLAAGHRVRARGVALGLLLRCRAGGQSNDPGAARPGAPRGVFGGTACSSPVAWRWAKSAKPVSSPACIASSVPLSAPPMRPPRCAEAAAPTIIPLAVGTEGVAAERARC